MVNVSAVRVPPDAAQVLAQLIGLSDEEYRALVGALSPAMPVVRMKDLSSAVESAVSRWDEDATSEFLGHIMSMCALLSGADFSAAELAQFVSEKLDLDESEEQASLADRLTGLLVAPGLEGISKALDVARENDRLWQRSRLLTDLRPIFREDASETPLGVVITHMLRIEYLESGRRRTISVALDSDDVSSLADAMTRAELKEQSLRLMADRSGLTVFSIDGESE